MLSIAVQWKRSRLVTIMPKIFHYFAYFRDFDRISIYLYVYSHETILFVKDVVFL